MYFFLMCNNMIITLNAMNVCCSSCMRMEIYNRLWKGLFIEQLHKSSCRWSWPDHCCLSWQTASAEQMLYQRILKNCPHSREHLSNPIHGYVSNASVWSRSTRTNPAKRDNMHYYLGSEHICTRKRGARKSVSLLTWRRPECPLLSKKSCSWANYTFNLIRDQTNKQTCIYCILANII